MREAQFLKQNADKWKGYEKEVRMDIGADRLAAHFVEITDDLAYARTFYPQSTTLRYLNGLASLFHLKIYRNKKEKTSRIWWFWQFELPYLFRQYHRQFLWAFIFFLVFCMMGALSAKYDENFIRLILGDDYVNMTLSNIEQGKPFGVYQEQTQLNMFFFIAYNNIQVAFFAYILGITFSIGTLGLLLRNGLMLGSFQYFFISKGLGFKFITVVFIHGTLEIWSIVIAGAAGFILGSSVLFPGTYSRGTSILRGGRDGLKIVFGLVPIFLVAAFLESFVTRYANMPLWLSLGILGSSLAFIAWYFIVYPLRLHNRILKEQQEQPLNFSLSTQNFNLWLSKKFSSGN